MDNNETMTLESVLEGHDDVTRGLQEQAQAAERLAESMERVEQTANRAQEAVRPRDSRGRFIPTDQQGGIGQQGQDSGIGGGIAPPRSPPPPFSNQPPIGNLGVNGPYQRAAALAEQLEELNQRGNADPNRVRDTEIALQQARRRVERLEEPPPSFGQRFAQFFSSSRFGAGPFSPLVGQVGQLAGLSTAQTGAILAHPATLAAGALLAFGKVLWDTTSRASDVAREFSSIRTITAATAAEAGRLQVFGLSAQGSRSLVDRINDDPYARGAAAQLGVTATPGPYGTLDTAKVTLDLVRALRNVKDERQRQRLIRQLGAEELAPAVRYSDRAFQGLERTSELRGELFDADTERRFSDFDAAQKRFGAAADNAKIGLSRTFSPIFTGMINSASDALDNLGKNAAEHGLRDFFFPIVGLGARIFNRGKRGEGGGGDGKAAEVADAHLKATQEQTAALSRLTRAIGGPRGQAAVPAALRGQNLARAMQTGRLRLGYT